MGLFNKKKEKDEKKNLIDSKGDKEKVANSALNFLLEKKIISDVNDISCEFGYIFHFPNHGYEALFKIIKEENIYYFALQGENLQFLKMDDNIFKAYQQSFLEMNS